MFAVEYFFFVQRCTKLYDSPRVMSLNENRFYSPKVPRTLDNFYTTAIYITMNFPKILYKSILNKNNNVLDLLNNLMMHQCLSWNFETSKIRVWLVILSIDKHVHKFCLLLSNMLIFAYESMMAITNDGPKLKFYRWVEEGKHGMIIVQLVLLR